MSAHQRTAEVAEGIDNLKILGGAVAAVVIFIVCVVEFVNESDHRRSLEIMQMKLAIAQYQQEQQP